MLDPDISTRDALRLLTVADDDPRLMDRRRFLQLVGMGVGAAALADLVPARLQHAFAATPVAPTDGIVVLIGLFGGLDGLNTVVPYTSSAYYAQHGAIAIPPAKVLPLNAQVGLHPNLPYLKSLYDRGEVAVVQGVGYPDPDLSHFSSMATWMYGHAGTATPTTGWVGRWLDGLATEDLLRAVSVGQGLPLHLVGDVRRGTAVPQWGVGFAGGSDPHDFWMYDAIRAFSAGTPLRGPWHDAVAATVKGVIDVGQEIGPVFDRPLPSGDLAQKMTVAARLINADLGLRVVDTGDDGFDTHGDQPTRLVDLFTDLDAALKAFFTTLDDRFRTRVTIMTYSEFGRTSWSNDSLGTDHGTSNNHFVIGKAVKGGLYGAQPSLAGLGRWDRMPFNVDFRSMYASVLDGWMGGGSSTVLGGTYPDLGLFRQAPGAGVASGSLPPRLQGDFVGITPARLYDSRSATRLLPLGAGTTAEIKVLGAGGVPLTDVTAVALNVTAVNGVQASSFTVWPEGGVKPDVANVSVPIGRASATAVIVEPGVGGRVLVTNDLGQAHCIVDVVGYFRGTTANRLTPVTPARLLDTRNGTGGRLGALGPNGLFDLITRGVGGVPLNADSVVLNVTAVRPTAAGFLTVYPSLMPRPATSSLNFAAGGVVPNLVIAKVGSNNKVSIFNAAGLTHTVVDVVGYFSTSPKGRYTALAPVALLDTRPTDVASVGPNSTTSVTVCGAGGVPATGVAAVAVNIEVRGPSTASYLTVWPSGVARPTTSNLNPVAGANCSNAAIVKVGVDGKVLLYNNAGTSDVVMSVVGWFSA